MGLDAPLRAKEVCDPTYSLLLQGDKSASAARLGGIPSCASAPLPGGFVLYSSSAARKGKRGSLIVIVVRFPVTLLCPHISSPCLLQRGSQRVRPARGLRRSEKTRCERSISPPRIGLERGQVAPLQLARPCLVQTSTHTWTLCNQHVSRPPR